MSLSINVTLVGGKRDRYRGHGHEGKQWGCGGKDWGRNDCHEWEKDDSYEHCGW